MNPSVPTGAAILLDFISGPESRGSYTVLFGDHDRGLPKPITAMTLHDLLSAQIGWGRQWGSNAAGRYQVMQPTLTEAMTGLHLPGTTLFSPDVQDAVGFWLLQRRGYAAFKARTLTTLAFGKSLAEEWASLPVLAPTQGAHLMLARGQSYYAGDALNHALVQPEAVEATLSRALAA